jgi:enoyl-CoA hydratase/carnithine racemase
MTSARQAQLPDELISVRIEDRSEGGQVAYVTVNNESKHNALPVAGRSLLAKIMNQLSLNPELRCVVLTGAGSKSFIGGANISEMAEFPDANIAESGSATTHAACDSIRRVPVPVIARINGYCLGAGMEIATSCDMRVASTNAKFGMPEVRYGVPSGMEACLIPLIVGWGKARELVFTGDIIDAAEAYHFGYISGPRSIRIQKQLISDWERMSITDAVQAGVRAVGLSHTTDEPRRLMSAWRERQRLRKKAGEAPGA